MSTQFHGTIGELAKTSGVPVETIRFYQRRGIMPIPRVRGSGRRRYGHEALEWLKFIRTAKSYGFTLKEIGALLDLRARPERTCRDVLDQVRGKLTAIDKQIEWLHQVKKHFEAIVASCGGHERVKSPCVILETLQPSTDPDCLESGCDGPEQCRKNGAS